MAAATIKIGQPALKFHLIQNGKIRENFQIIKERLSWWTLGFLVWTLSESNHVVKKPHKYKSQGFDVSVFSLDGMDSRTASRFTDANQLKEQTECQKMGQTIENKLRIGHVSDLKKWESATAQQWDV